MDRETQTIDGQSSRGNRDSHDCFLKYGIYHDLNHLTGSNVVTDENGDVVESLDYYPYGSIRIDDITGSYGGERRKFAGTEYDSATSLNYMGARYYAGNTAQFISQDPVFINMGVDGRTEVVLQNPQLANSYSYTANNPLKYVDKDGEFLDVLVDIGFTLYSGYKLGEAIFTGGDIRGEAANFALDAGGIFVPGAVGLGTVKRAANGADNFIDAANFSEEALKRQGKPFTPKGKTEVRQQNQAKYGEETCVGCGVKVIEPTKSIRGQSTPPSQSQVDHAIPKSQGGPGHPENGQVLCAPCNQSKGNKLISFPE